MTLRISHLPTGSATRDRPSETHCKLRSSAAVGISKPPISTKVPRRGTDYPKPTASCKAAPLWVEQSPHTPIGSATRDRPSETHCKLQSSAAVGRAIPPHPLGSATRDRPSETHCKLRSSAAVGISHPPISPIGSATRDRLSETHCKLRSSAAVGISKPPISP